MLARVLLLVTAIVNANPLIEARSYYTPCPHHSKIYNALLNYTGASSFCSEQLSLHPATISTTSIKSVTLTSAVQVAVTVTETALATTSKTLTSTSSITSTITSVTTTTITSTSTVLYTVPGATTLKAGSTTTTVTPTTVTGRTTITHTSVITSTSKVASGVHSVTSTITVTAATGASLPACATSTAAKVKRARDVTTPSALEDFRDLQISAGCSCLSLKPHTITLSATMTRTSTATTTGKVTSTFTITSTRTSTITSQASITAAITITGTSTSTRMIIVTHTVSSLSTATTPAVTVAMTPTTSVQYTSTVVVNATMIVTNTTASTTTVLSTTTVGGSVVTPTAFYLKSFANGGRYVSLANYTGGAFYLDQLTVQGADMFSFNAAHQLVVVTNGSQYNGYVAVGTPAGYAAYDDWFPLEVTASGIDGNRPPLCCGMNSARLLTCEYGEIYGDCFSDGLYQGPAAAATQDYDYQAYDCQAVTLSIVLS